jgi:hypothetical protein
MQDIWEIQGPRGKEKDETDDESTASKSARGALIGSICNMLYTRSFQKKQNNAEFES